MDPLPSEIVINESNFPDAVFRNYTAFRRLFCYDNRITSLDLSNNPIQINNLEGSGISEVHYSLRFGDTLSLRVYLTPSSVPIDGDSVTVAGGYEGAVIEKSQSGNRYAVTISNIPATALVSAFTISYNGATIVVSPASYVYGMLSSTSDEIGDDARMLVSALYYYMIALNN